MPVLKIKKNGVWTEVWGAISDTTATAPKLTSISIPASGWGGSTNPYSQVVACSGVNANSRLELVPTPAQVVELQEAEISLMISNNNGVVTVYALNDKPTSDFIMDVLITEVTIV